jgi:isoleucyl-tRNA synthetase
MLRQLGRLLAEDAGQQVTVQGPRGPVTGSVEQVIGRLGMPDMGGSYFTFSNENNYQIWGFLQKCHEKGWLYKGRDVMPWCHRCGTGLSQHEIVTDGYKEVAHDSVFLRFPLTRKGEETAANNEALLVWTTTPWTLTSNVAAAVGADLTYVKVAHEDGWSYYLAKGALKNSLTGRYEVVDELPGTQMVGWEYAGPFDELPAVADAIRAHDYTHRVISWREVGEAEGTGIVHIAPGCGAEDFALSREFELPVVAPLDEAGIYGDGFSWLTGRHVTSVADDIFANLREKGLYYRKQRYSHRYPHCWRCGAELVFRLVDEWFVDMGVVYDKPRDQLTAEEKAASLRYQIMDVVDQIRWIPAFGYDREMDWLRNMQNWMISKKRYWGLALPIWVCEDRTCNHFHVVGSDEELEERAVEGWETFAGHTPHRPYIDAVKIACPKCGGKASRIADVGNPWLDAGIVAFSTMHFREEPEFWEEWFPADFISESFPGQFRNWFYSLLAQSTVLTNRPPFLTIMGYASLLAEDGREMHKSWGNAIEFNEAANNMGADVMRWLYLNQKPQQNLLFGYHRGDETRRRFMLTLWNVYSFFVTYARLDNWQPTTERPVSPLPANAQLDDWIRARLDETTLATTDALENYDAERATIAAEGLLDDLSNWYVRRSRRRFWKSGADADKEAAYATLYHLLVEMSKLLAPMIPFTTETMYQNLVRTQDENAPASVHHCLYPQADDATLDHRLLDKMHLAILCAGLGRAARSAADIKLRQPLAKARVNVATQREREDLLELADVIAEEINVKELEVVSAVGELVNYRVLPNNRLLGPKLGSDFPVVRQALLALDPAWVAHELQVTGEVAVTVNGDKVVLNVEEVVVQTESKGGLAVASDQGVTVAVDTEITPALRQEGYARDLVRAINTLRKEVGLEISDRIALYYEAEGEVGEAMRNFAGYIQDETLAVLLQPADQETSAGRDELVARTLTAGDLPITISFHKVDL